MTFCEDVVVYTLALDRAFKDFEFIHVYLGPARLRAASRRIRPARALEGLRELRRALASSGVPDVAPRFRRAYVRDFLDAVIAQAEVFAFGRRRPFEETVRGLLAAPVPPAFDLDVELAGLERLLRKQGFSSCAEFNRSKARVRLRGRKELEAWVLRFIEEIGRRLAGRCGRAFGCDVRRILAEGSLRVVAPRKGDPPCFYRYQGDGRGELGIALETDFSETFLQNFVSHEAVPGHHFYYLLKQRRMDSGRTDAVDGIDTYYSPENAINEGLAVCPDVLWGQLLSGPAHLAAQVEKFLHRLFYNCWRDVNIARRPVGRRAMSILHKEFLYSELLISQRLRYYTREARFYSPVYPTGVRLIEESAGGRDPLPPASFYEQHSAETLQRWRAAWKKDRAAAAYMVE